MERERNRRASPSDGARKPGLRRPRGTDAAGATRARAAAVIQPDDLDRRIITMLRADGRRSNRDIARTLDVPEATVRYRVRRLTEGGVLKITASVDPEHLGYALTAVISVHIEPRQLVTAAHAISTMPEVMWLSITAGVSDVMLIASFHSHEEMFEFITERLALVAGTARTETSVCLRVVKKMHEWATELTSSLSDPAALDALVAEAGIADAAYVESAHV